MTTTPARARLRGLLDSRELIVAPGVYDGISAHLVKRTGHAAAYLTGAGVAAAGFGLPDIGLVTQTEMVERIRVAVRALGDVPLLADADTGCGAPLNAVRTVREYEDAVEGADLLFVEAPQSAAEIEQIAAERSSSATRSTQGCPR